MENGKNLTQSEDVAIVVDDTPSRQPHPLTFEDDIEGDASANQAQYCSAVTPRKESSETDDDIVKPPEFPFLCGFAEPIDANPSHFPVDLASFASILATETHTSSSWVRDLAIQCATTSTIWIKIIMLASIVTSSIFPRCTSNSQCKPGLFCLPLAIMGLDGGNWPTETRGNSICNDCSFTFFLNQTFDGIFSSSPEAQEFLMEGKNYCANDDSNRCDFLRSERGKYSILSMVVLCFLCGMFGQMIYNDLDNLHMQQKLYDFRFELMAIALKQDSSRASSSKRIREYCVRVVNWFAFTSRAYILPSWMFSGAALLLTSRAPTTRNLILVPIQIGCITNFDMVFEFLFFRQTFKDYTKAAAKKGFELQYKQRTQTRLSSSTLYDKILAIITRLYSFGLAIQIPIFVFNAESIFPFVSFFLDTAGGALTMPIPLPCTDVMFSGISFPLLLSVPMTLMLGPIVKNCRCSLLHLIYYASTFLFVLYSWVPVFGFMSVTHFRSI